MGWILVWWSKKCKIYLEFEFHWLFILETRRHIIFHFVWVQVVSIYGNDCPSWFDVVVVVLYVENSILCNLERNLILKCVRLTQQTKRLITIMKWITKGFLTLGPVKSSTFNTEPLGLSSIVRNKVPLASPLSISRFLRIIPGAPGFVWKQCGGKNPGLKLSICSFVYFERSSVAQFFERLSKMGSFGLNLWIHFLLISFIFSFVGDNTTALGPCVFVWIFGYISSKKLSRSQMKKQKRQIPDSK